MSYHINIKRLYIWLAVFSFIPISGLYAGDSRILTLEESINIGLESSVDIRRYQELLNRDQEYVRATRANLKSNANISFEIPAFEQSVEGIKDIEGFTHYAYTTNTKWRSILNINQPLPTNGNVSVNYDFFYHIQKSQLNKYSNYLYLKFEQPIFTPNTLSMGIRRAEIGYERTELQYTERKLNLIYNITSNYFNCFYHTINTGIGERAVSRLNNAYRASQSLFADGKLEETDVLQLEIELSKARDEVLSSQSNRDRNLNSFKQLIGIPAEENIQVDTTINYNSIKLDEAKIVAEGIKRSTGIKLHEMEREENEMRKVDADRESEFKGSIVATYGLDKKDPEFDHSYRNFDKTQSLMMQFYLPIWDWGKNQARIAAAEAQIRSSVIQVEQNKNNVIRGLRDRINDLKNHIRRLDILSKSSVIAKRNYDISLKYFLENRIKSQELILTQNQLAETEESFVEAYYDYQIALADLLRKVSGAG